MPFFSGLSNGPCAVCGPPRLSRPIGCFVLSRLRFLELTLWGSKAAVLVIYDTFRTSLKDWTQTTFPVTNSEHGREKSTISLLLKFLQNYVFLYVSSSYQACPLLVVLVLDVSDFFSRLVFFCLFSCWMTFFQLTVDIGIQSQNFPLCGKFPAKYINGLLNRHLVCFLFADLSLRGLLCGLPLRLSLVCIWVALLSVFR